MSKKVILSGKECIKVEFEGDDIPYFANGRAFIRVSDEDKKISQKELKKLKKLQNTTLSLFFKMLTKTLLGNFPLISTKV